MPRVVLFLFVVAAGVSVLVASRGAGVVSSASAEAQGGRHAAVFPEYASGQRLDAQKPSVVRTVLPVSEPAVSLVEFLQRELCASDAVIVGVPIAKESHLTAEQTFVYTDYDVRVTEVFKHAGGTQPLQEGNQIVVARPGGAVVVKGEKLTALDRRFQPLDTGRHYVLFLEYIPQTGGYKARSGKGDLLLDDTRVQKLTNEHLPREIDKAPREYLLQTLRTVVAGGCS
jgi:hypothetical protein